MEHYGTYNTEEIHSFSQTPVFMKKKNYQFEVSLKTILANQFLYFMFLKGQYVHKYGCESSK